MNKRGLVFVAVLCVLGAGLYLISGWPTDTKNDTVDRDTTAVDSPRRKPFSNAKLSKKHRIEQMKAGLAVVATAPAREPAKDKTGWDEVPDELDRLLAKEPVDSEASAQYASEAAKFVEESGAVGTSVVEATCGKSMCKVRYRHSSGETFRDYQYRLAFMPWKGASNYFSVERVDDETITSSIWLGRDGFDLPLDDLRLSHATGEFAGQ